MNTVRARQDPKLSRDHDARRSAIRKAIRSRLIGTQEELRQILERDGFEVTQATLSRDLARIGARRVALPEGGTAYEVDEARDGPGPDVLAAMFALVTSVDDTDALIIAKTLPGTASAVATAIDRARLPMVAGTLAGDDTIFIAPSKGVRPARPARELSLLWSKG